jgi:4-hydroxy-2-oxoheptanedioate aldolase
MGALNAATMVVIMIETAEVLEQLDNIAAVGGVDLLLIGTNDLCASLGSLLDAGTSGVSSHRRGDRCAQARGHHEPAACWST